MSDPKVQIPPKQHPKCRCGQAGQIGPDDYQKYWCVPCWNDLNRGNAGWWSRH